MCMAKMERSLKCPVLRLKHLLQVSTKYTTFVSLDIMQQFNAQHKHKLVN